MTYGECMKAARLNMGVTLQHFSDLSGVSYSMISCCENDKANPTLPVLAAMADTLGLTLDEYVGHVKCECKVKRRKKYYEDDET